MNKVQQYLIQDLDNSELKKYWEYVLENNINSFEWIEKSSNRRDELLKLDLRCLICTKQGIDDNYIHITETGICKCNKGHNCIEYFDKILYN